MATRGAQAHQAFPVAHATPIYQVALQRSQAALTSSVGDAQAQLMAPRVIYNELLQQSSLLAYVDDCRWLALLSFVSILAVLWMKRVSAKGTVAVH